MNSDVILRHMGDLPAPGRPATYADLLALPDHVVGEIVGGELFVSPRPAPRHATASSGIGGKLWPPYHDGHGGPGGWVILAVLAGDDEACMAPFTDITIPLASLWAD